MNFVDSLKIFGVEARQKPSITGSGAPTTETEGAVGEFYMDTDTGDIYKCTAVTDGVYTWKNTNIDFVAKCCPSFTESGSVVTCNPVEDYPLNVVSHIEYVQSGSGDPSPENVRPITGWEQVKVRRDGKNLFNAANLSSSVWDRISVNGDTITCNFLSGGIHFANKTVFPAGTYTLSAISDDVFYFIAFVRKASDNSNITQLWMSKSGSEKTFTVSEPFKLAFGGIATDGIYYGEYTFRLQFEVGTTATEYEAYRGEEITFDLGQTVYGGNLDRKTGLLTIIKTLVTFDGTEGWKAYGSTSGSYTSRFYINRPDKKVGYRSGVCNMFTNTNSSTAYDAEEAQSGMFNGHATNTCLYFAWGEVGQTLAEWKAWLAEQYANGTPVQVVYELAEPVTVQLTPQEILGLSGINTLYSDTGDTDVSGKADPNAVLEKLTNAIIALGGNV